MTKKLERCTVAFKKQGYEDIKEFFVSFCFEEKEITKDGKNYQENCLPWHIQHRG